MPPARLPGNSATGDIITDFPAVIQGGLGIAAGGNINPNGRSMFEPMGASAPKHTGRNVISPLATITRHRGASLPRPGDRTHATPGALS